MIFQSIQQIKKYKGIFIADDIASWGGGSAPILNYLKFLGHDQEEYKLIIINRRYGFLKLIFSFIFQKNIIIVGFDPLKYLSILFLSLLKKNIVIFPQTVEYQIREFFSSCHHKFLFKKLMKNKKIACVSDFQKSFFIQNYNSSNIKTIGAVILTEPKILENKIINILMVGYYSKLKGVNFFSEIADLAKKKGLEYKFNWLGDGPHGDLYFSPNVSWLGYSSNPKITMQSIDLFFLSSIEDSIPLVVYEALELHKKCVAYKNNGVAQILQKIDGCSVFEEYTPIQALNSIHQSINTEFSHTDALNYVSDFSNGKNFQKKLELLINE